MWTVAATISTACSHVMADPLTLLAPPVGPEAPAVLALPSPAVSTGLVWIVAALLTGLVLLAMGTLVWWRRRWSRDLRIVRSAATPIAAAEQLARAARRRGVQATAEWWRSLDRLRFGRPSPDQAPQLERLLADAETFSPCDRPWPRGTSHLARRSGA